MEKRIGNISVENAKIMFTNFRGEKSRYNPTGMKNFCVVIEDPQQAQQLAEDGWNVRILAPREEGDKPKHYINVTVRFDILPPKVVLVTRKNKTPLNDETIATLDHAEIVNIDLTIRPRIWHDDDGNTKVKAYLKTMYVTIEEDEFADKYADEGPEDF